MRRMLLRLKEHWVRHLLAALQVAVGVAVVTAVLVDVVPILRSRDAGGGADVFSAIYGTTYPYVSRSAVWTVDDVAYLESQVDSIVAASVYQDQFLALLRVDGELYMTRAYARVGPGFDEVAQLRLVAGRFFDESDVQGAEAQVAVISSRLAEALFPGRDAIGEVINIRPEAEASRVAGFASPGSVSTEGAPGLDVRVIGIYEHPEGTPAYAGFFSEGMRVEFLLPATGRPSWALTAVTTTSGSPLDQERQRSILASIDERYTVLYFRAAKGMGEQAAAEVEALLRARLEARQGSTSGGFDDGGSSLIVAPAMPGGQAALQGQLTGSLILGALGIAALIVSGFSIFTTFLANVAERVRSIGLSRALGATRWRIVREVVGEAAILSATGGLIGVALSFPLRALLLQQLLTVKPPGVVDLVITITGALLLAVAIGTLAALYPGWTVARLSPAEAFYEQ